MHFITQKIAAVALAGTLCLHAATASAQTAPPSPPYIPPTFPQLTAAQCTTLNSDLQKYIAHVKQYFPKQAQVLIADATAVYNKLCPTNLATPFECIVNAGNANNPIGVSSTGDLTDYSTNYKTVCMSQNACQNIVSLAFRLVATKPLAVCTQTGNQTVIPMTDAQVQAAINVVLSTP